MNGITGNIAVMNVISMTDTRTVLIMTKKNFDNEKKYQITMKLARNMMKQGLITADEYTVIDTIFTEKYKPILGTLFSELT